MNHRFLPASSIQSLLFLCFIRSIACVDDPAYLAGQVSINCGSNTISAARSGRAWLGEKFVSSLQIKGESTISSVIHESVSDNPVQYKTARISRSSFSYWFRVSAGQKFLRFHFNPTLYNGFKKLKDLFSVEAGPFTLLGNFSASLTSNALGASYFTKEFCINVKENQALEIVFSPVNSQSRDIYAFINGIEIIPVALGHSYFYSGGIGAQVLGHEAQLFYINDGTALEMVRRLKVRRDSVLSGDDLSDMFGTVEMVPKDEANDMTWKMDADVGFRYLIRLYFSNQGLKMMENGEVIFEVFINKVLTRIKMDIVRKSVNNGILKFSHKDYVVTMEGRKEEGKRDLLISLQSCGEFENGCKPFKGFEVFKLSNPDYSLASPNPLPPAEESPLWNIQTSLSTFGNINAIAAVAITIIAMLNIIAHMLGKIWKPNGVEEENKVSARVERSCRYFSLKEIQLGARNFSDTHLIGKGGFGKVYKCVIDNGSETVAVKRLKSKSRQGPLEFLTEIETLSELRHVNLLSLIGYCKENQEMIIVYEYMANGTLADHLYNLARKGISYSPLTWKQRLNICIGAARGLDYLHTGHSIIHRDVKVSNILLDRNFTAKVSDFGLVKQVDRNLLQSHVSTKVKGTFGYIDPNYLTTGKLTIKSDTYAFGVVLLEVLCGRPAIDQSVAMDEQILTKWARDKISEGKVDMIIDSSLRGEISRDSLKAFIGVVERCLDDEPKKRPTIAQVVLQLEFVLEQQDTTISSVPNEKETLAPSDDEFSLSDIRQLIKNSKNVETSTSVPRIRFNRNTENSYLSSGENLRRAKANKPSWLPWSALWKRFKPSKKNEVSIPGAKLPKFDPNMIAIATNHFSPSNEIGRGGFGSVYKAVLPTGQIVAVKRLSSLSMMTHNEFQNEILLLQNLQHRNIIKLVGYCIHGNERVLVYEFLENGSLDTFIFGEKQRRALQWAQRIKIIMGIARGLQYMHQDSGLRIIHRDPKPANILLDSEMNPKISDFGIARSFEEDQSFVETIVAGTLGYISPESFSSGTFSAMSDVYTFGVVVLEIVSGKRNRDFHGNDKDMHLVDFAWKLWNDGRVLDLVDESVEDSIVEGALRCIQVGLLCTRQEPHDRPTMSSVVDMMDGKQLIWL